MILDLQTQFSGTTAVDGTKTAQAITATAISTNVLDVRQAALPALVDEGLLGAELYLNVQVIQAFNTLTSLTVTLESDSTANLATAPVVHIATAAILLAALTAGAVIARIKLPSADYKRYVGVRYTVGGAAPTLGSVLAFLSVGTQRNVIYPTGISIDV